MRLVRISERDVLRGSRINHLAWGADLVGSEDAGPIATGSRSLLPTVTEPLPDSSSPATGSLRPVNELNLRHGVMSTPAILHCTWKAMNNIPNRTCAQLRAETIGTSRGVCRQEIAPYRACSHRPGAVLPKNRIMARALDQQGPQHGLLFSVGGKITPKSRASPTNVARAVSTGRPTLKVVFLLPFSG